jgi:hypothetical protein
MTTWTYTGMASLSDLDYVRFNIGDTEQSTAILLDEEINIVLTLTGNKNKAVQKCMEITLLKLSKECDYSIGPEKVTASQRYENYKNMYTLIKSNMLNTAIVPQQTDTVDSIFTLGFMDNGR